jgi:hypothetical protein
LKRLLSLLLLLSFALASLIPTPARAADEKKEKRFTFGGDFRGRYEGFWFKEDYDGSKKDHRSRLRYRLRLNAKARINDHGAFAMRVGTGDLDHRSGNQTLGDPMDFAPNEFDIRRAYIIINPYTDGTLPGREGSWAFQFGRIPNPFLWKESPDKLLWDSDINLSGMSTTFDTDVGGSANIWANLAYAIIDEMGGDEDPYLAAAQAGIKGAGDSVEGGIRGTYYAFAQLDSNFVKRGVNSKETDAVTSSAGNIRDGLTGDPNGGSMNVVETKAFLKFSWASLLFTADYSVNLDAQASELEPGIGKENVAYSIGGVIGDKKKNVRVGAGYYAIEANAFPSQFIDSDILDGVTNRKGFLVAASRQVWPKSDLNVTVLNSAPVNEDTMFANSIKASKRTRLQVDLVYKF